MNQSRWIGYTSDTDILGTDEKSGERDHGSYPAAIFSVLLFSVFRGKDYGQVNKVC